MNIRFSWHLVNVTRQLGSIWEHGNVKGIIFQNLGMIRHTDRQSAGKGDSWPESSRIIFLHHWCLSNMRVKNAEVIKILNNILQSFRSYLVASKSPMTHLGILRVRKVRTMIDIILDLKTSRSNLSEFGKVTPLHAGRQCWGKSILPRAILDQKNLTGSAGGAREGQNMAHLGHFNGKCAQMHYFDLPWPPLPTRSNFFGPKWLVHVSHI